MCWKMPSVFEVGMMRSLRFGSGVVVARLPNGTWSAPSAIATGKLSAKGQFGMELTDFVYVLNTETAVEKFSEARSITLGQGVSIADGPFGRIAELAGDTYTADIFAYCKTKSVFGGSTLEGATIGERADANRKMYQEPVTPRRLLAGEVTLPPETYPLMKILHSPLLRPVSRRASVDSYPKARRVPQNSIATELPSEPTGRRSSQMTISPVKEEPRFYGRRMTPHHITIEITDYSGVELPLSLTSDPDSAQTSPDRESTGSPARMPTVLKPGRRTWSGSSSGTWSRHDALPFE
ncbi:hypothetical protein BJX99DRAFT_268158 [Aspergillus californicus]